MAFRQGSPLKPNIQHLTSFPVSLEMFKYTVFGWICLRCSESAGSDDGEGAGLARFFSEGEAEEKDPGISTRGLARWRDASRQILFCPDCHTEERVSMA